MYEMKGLSRLLWGVPLAGAAVVSWSTGSATISYSDLLSRPPPRPTLTRAYGSAPHQQAELFLPVGEGSHRVIVLIHGGCWLASLPGTELMDYLAGDLQKRGYAVWNIDYRRIGDAGAGYPGTFQDVAAAIDSLRALAPTYRLDLKNVVVIGHSAGGQLGLWAAARVHLPKTSILHTADPMPIAAVVSLAGIDDLKSYRERGPDACGGPQTIDALVGTASSTHRDVYADTSPVELLPICARQAIISGKDDPIVPPHFGEAYALAAKAAGDTVIMRTIPGAGHFELIDPTSAAWREILRALDEQEKPAAP
jgi:acetyl esterase/lipase